MLWAPVSAALGVALGAAPDVAWPLVLRALADTQADILAGRGGGEAGEHQHHVLPSAICRAFVEGQACQYTLGPKLWGCNERSETSVSLNRPTNTCNYDCMHARAQIGRSSDNL